MKKILLSLLLLLSIFPTSLFAQDKTITGIIRDSENGDPLPGVTIVASSSGKTAISDGNGQFSITVTSKDQQVAFSYVGYKTLEKNTNSSFGNIRLVSENTALKEVVVVGYGTQSKKEFTGSAARVTAKAIKDIPVQSFEQALIGKASGVNVSTPSGVLNDPPVIRIRGVNSISLSSYPLVVVDGIPVNTGDISTTNSVANNPLADINPADIESIDILKDAASTSIYGSRAAGGVLLITTKKGKQGKAKVTYDSWVGITRATRLPDLLDAEQYETIKNEAVLNSKILAGNENNAAVASALFFPSYNADGSRVNTKWKDLVYRDAVSQNHNIGISGGTESTRYYFSTNYSKQEGITKDNEFERKGARFNIDHDVNSWLKLGGNLSYNNTFNQAQNTGSLSSSGLLLIGAARLAFALPPNVSAYNADGSYNLSSTGTASPGNNLFTNTLWHPGALFENSRYTSTNDHFVGNIHATITFFDGFKFDSNYGIDRLKSENITYLSPNLGSSAYATAGSATNIAATRNNYNFTNSLSFDRRFGANHHIAALAGYDVQKYENSSWGANQTNVSDPFFENYQGTWGTIRSSGNGLSERLFLSSFFRLSYDYGGKYFLTGNFRKDGNSALGVNNKYGNFGGISTGWSVSEEAFFKNSSISNYLNSLKLKGSWGRVGNGNLSSAYASQNLYSSSIYGSAATWALSQAGNEDLGWETSDQTNIGLEAGFFKDRLQLSADYFNNNVNGLILSSPQSPSKGIPGNSILSNVGSMYNRGIELGLNASIINKEDFQWKASFNYTHVKNKVTALAEGNTDIIGYTQVTTEANNITRVGYSAGSLYGAVTAGVNPENGRRIFLNKNGEKVQYSAAAPSGQSNWTYLDGTTAAAITVADYQVLGNALPVWYGGLTNNIQYKAFDFTVGFTYSGGNKVMNNTRGTLLDQRFYNNSTEILNRWTTPGQVTNIPRLVYNDVISNGSSGFALSDNAEKADFLRLQQLAIGFSLPKNILAKAQLASVRVYAQATNLFLITSYSGTDPETSSNGDSTTSMGVEKNSVGQGRTFTVGLNVGF
ncbi:SusC/RagA family TonB-linked outer membrane protein [Flavobacterium chungbukense]|uniref:TonB-dependent receptor n=1 Tax=Flavobacterium chungbukense TaxID=877464 RepID=A0ABP7YM85_9FLAO|nr:SusC/RagA family TonB-linked outer membrane protein [Flavobacterium chungbukense]MCC4919844.1 SusC/RagA family TonB-linked outer membrane protein [Flavobacterium chungbukense]